MEWMVCSTLSEGLVFELFTHGLDPDAVREAKDVLRLFSPEEVRTRSVDEIPRDYLNRLRSQYDGFLVAKWLATLRLVSGSIVVGVLNVDAYVELLNFIFGLALPALNTATVYVTRLRSWASRDLFLARVRKEVVHELGHVFGLEHCRERRCVMSFSNSLAEVDRKDYRMCGLHYTELRRRVPNVGGELRLPP